MAKNGLPMQEDLSTRDKVLYTAAMLFFEQGYKKTSVREIAKRAKVNRGSVFFVIKSKENLLYTLVSFVLESLFTSGQFAATGTDDPILSYAVETALQLYMAESREQVRELASTAYALPSTSDLIYRRTAARLMELLSAYNPGWEETDFFEREIASGGILRSFMERPCDASFPMERKVRLFLETTLKIYNVPQEQTDKAIAYLSGLDLPTLAERAMNNMRDVLKTQNYEK